MSKKIITKVLFLRKKPVGENSIEELAYTLVSYIADLQLVTLPEESNTLTHIIKNICFAKRYQGDINHIFSPTEAYLAVFLRGKKIITWHDVKTALLSRSRLKGVLRKWFYITIPSLFADQITCISKFTAGELIAECGWLQTKVKIIYNPYNPLVEFCPKVFNTDSPVILHIGTAERKNLLRVLEALCGLKCKLIIVGRLNSIQREFLREHSEIYYEHYEDIDFEQIIQLYQACDIVSFPSFYEGFGMPVIEANATGRVVLTSPEAAIPEIAADSVCYVSPADVGSIKAGFELLIHNAEYRKLLLQRGVENAKRFEIQLIVSHYHSLYI